MMSKNINDLVIRNRELHIHYPEGFYTPWAGTPDNRRLQSKPIKPIEIYMLCPQFGAIHHGSDIERFTNWFSALQVSSQCRGGMRHHLFPVAMFK